MSTFQDKSFKKHKEGVLQYHKELLHGLERVIQHARRASPDRTSSDSASPDRVPKDKEGTLFQTFR